MKKTIFFKRISRGLLDLVLISAVLLSISVSAYADEYIHGYLRYSVEDNSVTITDYRGREEVVTVPAMIGGNPVNTIAAGAFANSATVREIHLPDTIMTVEDGAFAPGQVVIYADSGTIGEPAGNGESAGEGEPAADTPPETAEPDSQPGQPTGIGPEDGSLPTTDQPAGNQPEDGSLPTTDQPAGIRLEDGSLLTTDDEGNLVLVDPSGTETVLDDTQSYSRGTDSTGAAVIRNHSGDPVTVRPGGEISFTDAENNRVIVLASDAGTSRRTESADGTQSYEEVNIDDSPATESTAAIPAGSGSAATTATTGGMEPSATPEPTPEPAATPATSPTPAAEAAEQNAAAEAAGQNAAAEQSSHTVIPAIALAALVAICGLIWFRKRK